MKIIAMAAGTGSVVAKEFIWASEKDGWRHLYRVTRDGKRSKDHQWQLTM